MKKKMLPWAVGIAILLLLIVGMYINKYHIVKDVSYIDFKSFMQNGQVEKVILSENEWISFYKKGDSVIYKTANPRQIDFKEELLLEGIVVQEVNASGVGVFQYMISATIFVGVFWIVFKRMGKGGMGGGRGAMSLQIKPIEPADLKQDFSHIAGNVEAKEQVLDLIDFMKDPGKYAAVGARMPKGAIFYGPPGTGKTLMAKAIAKEANVPFFSVSGSDFVELYVGVGAGRVREIFAEARKHEKAVIFIDEIDAIGKKRSQNAMGSNDEKDQTLNALLTEMSGFNNDTGIIILAATNRLELLDDALLRPGRFDRQIEIGYPDLAARKQILSLHFKGKPIGEDVALEVLATQTVYFTGAMLENLMNESAILAANEDKCVINQELIDRAFYRVIAGAEKKDRSGITPKERQITAYHEAGHALITKLLAPDHRVTKVTIVPSTKGAGGFSMNVPKDKMYMTRQELRTQIQISLAGRAAEELVFGKDQVTTGASNDIEKATSYLCDFMTRYGMDDELGLVNRSILLGREASDERLVERIQSEMSQIYEATRDVISQNYDQLERLAQALLEKENLGEREIDDLLKVA
ncbi:MAG: ATP-dependent metallopeptidase FtsH/Yme1/Tma family protein [Cellulosilyticaceae bacterium]